MIKFTWNNVNFTVTDLGGGILNGNIARHSHAMNCYELHFITDGKGTLITDDKEYDLMKNDLFITGPNFYHAQYGDDINPVEDVFVLIQAENIKKANALSSLFLSTSFYFCRDFDTAIPQILLNEYRQKGLDYQSACGGLLIKILSDILREIAPKSYINISASENLNDRRFAIIEQAFLYDKDLTLTKLSEKIGLCERQTQRLLKKYYNKTFRQKKKESR